MNRKEYLATLNQPAPESADFEDKHHPVFLSLAEYLAMRRKCAEYEESENISDYLTEEDYRLFDQNFENALHDALYKDNEFEKDEVERSIEMMKSVNWTWAHGLTSNRKPSTPTCEEFISTIRYCYESCFNSGSAHSFCGTGGISVEIDILDHFVKIQFSSIDVFAFDGDDSH